MSKNITWTDRDHFFESGISRIVKVDTILDIGCGIRPHNYCSPYIYICCEPYIEYVDVLKKKVKDNTDSLYVILNYDWEEVVNKFEERSVDTVYLLDVIEHLDKETGKRLLKMTEKIARKQIIIFTPLGFVENKELDDGKDAWGLHGGKWQEHKSGWLPEDFDDNWDIIVCRDFHSHNNIGEKLDTPFGAFWAIKNIKESINTLPAFPLPSELFPIIFEQGRHVISLFKQEILNSEQAKVTAELQIKDFVEENAKLLQIIASLEQEKSLAEQNKIVLEQKITSLRQEIETSDRNYTVIEHEKSVLEHKEAILEQEKVILEQEKAILEQENAILEQERVQNELETANLEQEKGELKQKIKYLEQENISLNKMRTSLEQEITTLRKRYRYFEFFRK